MTLDINNNSSYHNFVKNHNINAQLKKVVIMTLNNSQSKKNICLITGASAGIGKAIAIVYAEMGWDLILTARRTKPMTELAEELERKYGTISHIFEVDFFEKSATQKLFKNIKAKNLKVSGLINNAGYGIQVFFSIVAGKIMKSSFS